MTFWHVVDGKLVEIPAERVRVVERAKFLAELQERGDAIAEDLAAELQLGDGLDVVYVLDEA